MREELMLKAVGFRDGFDAVFLLSYP